jgi:tight adherence protein C
VKIAAVFLAWFAGLLVLFFVGRQLTTRRRTRDRVYEGIDTDAQKRAPEAEEVRGFLSRWLYLAGFRSRAAAPIFVGLTLLGFALGGALAYFMITKGVLDTLLRTLQSFPGGIGDIFLPLAYAAPWAGIPIFGFLPWQFVYRARQRRIIQIEQDLPLVLELLATLSEAGLGFDQALQRILEAQPPERPLTTELRLFQTEVLAGRAKVHCLRRLARRIEVTSVTIFVSALVQAEQVGAGVADVLRRQSDDLRDRRREQAVAFATALPAKLLFPLVICFLPAIFAVTLGPTFFQFFQFVDTIIRTRTGGP